MDFSLMETEDLEILLKITEIDIKLAELEEKQRKANQKRRRRMSVQWTRIMRRTLFGQYENLLAELNREDPKRYRNFLRVARYGQLVRPLRSLRSAPTVSTVSLTVRNFCSSAKIPYGQYGQHGHAPGHPTVYAVT